MSEPKTSNNAAPPSNIFPSADSIKSITASTISSSTLIRNDAQITAVASHHQYRPTLLQEVTAGAVAGIAGTLIGYPMDTIKVYLQTEGKHYKGPIDCFLKVTKSEGFMGLFRGVTSPLVGLTVLNSFGFGIYSQMKQVVQHEKLSFLFNKKEGTTLLPQATETKPSSVATGGRYAASAQQLTFLQYYLAGGLTGVINSSLSSPFDILKIRMQVDGKSKQFKSTWDCLVSTTKQYGIRHALYMGAFTNVFREFLFCSAYFGTYESLKSYLAQRHAHEQGDASQFHVSRVVLAGAMSGVAGWMCCFPIDVVFSNIQRDVVRQQIELGAAGKPDMIKSKSVKQVAMDIYRNHGMKGFFRGLGTSVFRACFVSSTRFLAYEATLRLLQSL